MYKPYVYVFQINLRSPSNILHLLLLFPLPIPVQLGCMSLHCAYFVNCCTLVRVGTMADGRENCKSLQLEITVCSVVVIVVVVVVAGR